MDVLAIIVGSLVLLILLILSRRASFQGRPPVSLSSRQNLPLDFMGQLHLEARDLLRQQLMEGESVKVIIHGPKDQALIATHRRLFIYKRGWLAGAFGGQRMGSWDYRNITGIEMETGILGGAIIVQVPGGPAVDRGYLSAFEIPNGIPIIAENYGLAARGVAEIRRLITEHQQEGNISQGSLGQELERLGSLHERGQLTDEEFVTMKRRLMGSG